jgi:hypothetical protein
MMLQSFAECVWEPGDIINLRCLQRDTGKVLQRWDTADSISLPWLQQANQSMDCYAGINPRKSVGGAGLADVLMARCLFAEFDETSLEEASRVVDYAGLPIPTCVLWSGGGPHLYWRLDRPMLDLAAWSVMQRRLIRLIGSDKSIHDAPRIMRLPGFFNHKPGRSASAVLWARPERRFSLAELASKMPAVSVFMTSRPSRDYCTNEEFRIKRARAYLQRVPPAISGQRGHDKTLRAACVLHKFGLSEDAAMELFQEWNERCVPLWNVKDLRRKLREAGTKAATTRTPIVN